MDLQPRQRLAPPPPSMGSRKNTKKLSLALPSSPPPRLVSPLRRRDEDGPEAAVPYADGPVQVIPGVWIGSEDNARDCNALLARGIRSILNVAKEVSSPFDALRSTISVPNPSSASQSTYYPPHPPAGRPPMHYLKLQWSHGQKDLVNDGFQAGMAFADAAEARGDGVLVHCQCGISRSATMVIALVMRAAAHRSPSVPQEVWDLEGMQGAYSYVKAKSKWIGPNMSLIYELLDYEKKLKFSSRSLASSGLTSDKEWFGKRQSLDRVPPFIPPFSDQDTVVMQEARALDKAMEDRVVARKSSASSFTSTASMGPPCRNRFHPRKRAGSIASNLTGNSIISESLVEADEEPELLGIGGGFDSERERRQSADTLESSATSSPDDDIEAAPPISHVFTSRPSHLHVPPSAPAWKSSFDTVPPPLRTAVRSTFDLPSSLKLKSKRRPSPSGLPPVPSSPVTVLVTPHEVNVPCRPPPVPASDHRLVHSPSQSLPIIGQISPRPLFSTSLPKSSLRQCTGSPRLVPSPIHLQEISTPAPLLSVTPHQTFFVFPPSPTLTTRTPSAATLTTTTPPVSVAKGGMVPFPSVSTPKISTFRQQGRTKSFIGIGTLMTPTTAFTKVEAQGYVGLE